jgi:uncharacterized protein (TIGR03437 family)
MARHPRIPLAVRHFATAVALTATAAFGWAASVPSLTISNETAPPGGWAQIKIYAAKPVAIASGHLVLTLDPTAFGTGAMVGLFGANGDATGLATTLAPTAAGQQIDVQFSSPTGGIGELAGLPVMVISVPVLAAAAGRTVTVSATSPDGSVSVGSGSVMVQRTLSVQKIFAGMGVVAAGTVVLVYGTGFTTSTTVAIDGVELASLRFVSAGEIDVTIGGATELVGKRVRVTDSGVEFDYFCFQPNDPVNFPLTTGFAAVVAPVQPLFPLFASTGFEGPSGVVGGVIEVQNPNPTAATVSLNFIGFGAIAAPQPLSIPAGSWGIFNGSDDSDFILSSNLPVRVVPMAFCSALPATQLPVCVTPVTPSDRATDGFSVPVLSPSSLAFAWQLGSSVLPAARTISIASIEASTPSVPSGGSWLSSTQGAVAGTISVSVNPSQLAVGTYQGSVLVTQALEGSATLPVSLTVTDSAVPVISATPGSISFTAPAFNATPYSQTIAVTSDYGSAPFTVTPMAGSGADAGPFAWLKVSPLSGTTPATLTVTWDPSVTSQIYYQQRSTSGSILISGLADTVTIPATFNVTGVQTFQTYLGASGMGPNGLVFSGQTGSAAQSQTIAVDPAGTISVTTNQQWITAVASTNQMVTVTANPAGLAAGVYTGAVTISEPGITPLAVPVTFGVWSTPPQLSISTGSFTLVQTVGEPPPPYQAAQVTSGGVPVPFTIAEGASWLNAYVPYDAPTPAQILVGLSNPPGLPGAYAGSFTLQSPGSSVYVPVTFLVEPGPAAQPVVSQVVNSASGIMAGVSPGEILTVCGYSVGAPASSGLTLTKSGSVASNLNGLEVTFDGKPAPLIYTAANQTNLIVPYEVFGQPSTVMQVTYAAYTGALQTAAWILPVVAAAPGVFTIDSTGTGQGAILNQDGSVNSAANPAARGSVVAIYATGEGQTSPPGVTGSVTQSNTKTPLLPVAVTIGGVNAVLQYHGEAPDAVAGLLQVNAVVPAGIATGSAVPITVSVGGVLSQPGVTISIK